MRNPFEELIQPPLPEFEEVSGSFSCQEKGCYSTVSKAKYFPSARLLTWLCANEHKNSVKDFEIDG